MELRPFHPRQDHWGTADELRFLADLGLRKQSTCKTDRRTLLQRYLDTMPQRTDWGTIHTAQIRAWVSQELQRLARATTSPVT